MDSNLQPAFPVLVSNIYIFCTSLPSYKFTYLTLKTHFKLNVSYVERKENVGFPIASLHKCTNQTVTLKIQLFNKESRDSIYNTNSLQQKRRKTKEVKSGMKLMTFTPQYYSHHLNQPNITLTNKSEPFLKQPTKRNYKP